MKLIIFDFDGTLGDPRGNIVTTMRQTLKQLGYPEASEDAIAAAGATYIIDDFAELLTLLP